MPRYRFEYERAVIYEAEFDAEDDDNALAMTDDPDEWVAACGLSEQDVSQRTDGPHRIGD